jgi:hypothetical protein
VSARSPRSRREPTDTSALVDRCIASFNQTDPRRRRDLIEQLYMPGAGYTDPHVELSGRKEIDEFIGAVQSNFLGYVFSLGGPVDAPP